MIKHIFKYPIKLPDVEAGKVIEIQMPSDCDVFDINHQDDCIFLWALVDVDAPLRTYKYIAYGTGWKIDNAENLFFLKTVHMPSGLVWHVFLVNE